MSAQDARGLEVAFSTAQLDDAGIDDDILDHELAEIVDDFFLSFPREFREHVAQWLDEHPRENAE